MACEMTVFPEPLSPTSATVLLAATSKETPLTASISTLVAFERDPQILDLQQWRQFDSKNS